MQVTRFYTTDDGGSAFDEFVFPITEEVTDAWGNALRFSKSFPCASVRVYEAPVGAFQDWHNAPARQLCVMMQGIWEVGTTDAETRHWGPGEVFMPDTVEGKGHTSRVIEGPVSMFFIPLPEDFHVTT
ncbi:MAG: hypothetical protein QGI68_08715 [Pseudomonadales bacterium]|jgi:hypothetical protein|nr:hypothetical protein [Pseudomonadales bacterium]MDP7357956.1 hypothetical protein [Pseudomonadales bacterium]MDP7595636.1 hypothetical protein [Pseudomonadales bacterium]HJN49640.1 hypothetical protein [Pseudomonadales bacterium]|tara:strand:- start:2546 stop:2929 length:384 start_codon:yes stop_codon:yes gene_type:complete